MQFVWIYLNMHYWLESDDSGLFTHSNFNDVYLTYLGRGRLSIVGSCYFPVMMEECMAGSDNCYQGGLHCHVIGLRFEELLEETLCT